MTTGDFSLILTRVYVILAMWAIMCIAVCVDLWAGVNSAKARGEKVYSGGLRRTFAKLGDYMAYTGDGLDIRFDREFHPLVQSTLRFDACDGRNRVNRGPKCLGKREGKEEPGGEITGCNSSYYSMR